MNQKYTIYILALFAGLCAATLSFFTPFFPYGEDSASYLDQARNIIKRGVFEKTPFGITDKDAVYIPDNLFPPGYPLLIVFSSLLLQQPVELIAPFLNLAALALLPYVIVLAFHRALGLLPAFWIGILVTLTPVTVRHGYLAYSDIISLVLVIYAIHRLLIAGHKPANWFSLGLLTGFSYLFRNANLGLLLCIGLYLGWQLIIEPTYRKEKINNGLIWLGANALIMLPWLIRNYLVFGKIQPYWMPPSTVSLSENIHDYLKAQLDTLLAFNDLDTLLAGTTRGLILLVILVIASILQTATSWQRWQKIEQQTFFISVVNAALGAAILIAARTKYQWGVHIDARYALQYSCFIFVAVAIIFKNTLLKITSRYWILGFVFTFLMTTRLYELPKLYEYNQRNQTILGAAKQIKANPDVVCTDLNGRFAVSNYAFIYRILCAAPVRHVFPHFQQNKFLEESLQEWAALGAKTGIVVSLFPYIDDKESGLPLNPEITIQLKALGWQVERNEKENLILSHELNTQP